MEQLSIFDLLPEEDKPQKTEPDIGEYVENNGANICHIMRPAYVGKKVIYDCSTENHKWRRCGVLEKYFLRMPDNIWRSVIYVGKEQRILYDHYPGREIFEPLKWTESQKRKSQKTDLISKGKLMNRIAKECHYDTEHPLESYAKLYATINDTETEDFSF